MPPSYYYHLKFELFSSPGSTTSTPASTKPTSKSAKPDPLEQRKPHPHREIQREREEEREVWLPRPESDIFDNKDWPSHKPVEVVRDTPPRRGDTSKETTGASSSKEHSGVATLLGSGAGIGRSTGVIDCGPSRASSIKTGVFDTGTSKGSGILEPIAADTKLEFPTPVPQRILRDLQTAEKDWRFGRVRVESLYIDLDMGTSGTGSGPRRPGGLEQRGRGESSSDVTQSQGQHPGGSESDNGTETERRDNANERGINAGLAASGGLGRVTKARYEVLEGAGKNTEVGWGVVHLYRDGEETPGLESGMEEIYTADEKTKSPPSSGGSEGDAEDCTTLCIPAVPSYLTPSDFLGFVGEKTREIVSHFRMVMTGRMNRYLVLMKFRDSGEAKRWREGWDGKVFNSMEPETCHVTFIKSITFQTPTSSRPNTSFPELSHDPFTPSSTSTFLKPFPPPTPNLVELPTCPVCLERMDDTTGLLTILCQHVFHCACLQKWRGSGCPVCRHTNPSLSLSPQNNSNPNTYPYDPTNPPFGSGEASLCSICDCTDDLWICLICGNVGCGRYKGGHAKEHWKESAHNFALEIETQHVWDYAGDMWVHRLIRDKGDGKVVELPSSSRPGRDDHGGDMDMVPREKLETIGMEYTHLLTSQLESQRVYFEELVSKAVAKASSASTAASLAHAKASEALSKLHDLELENKKLTEETIPELERDLSREKKKAERSAEMARGFGKSLVEEKKVSEGLLKRVEFVNKGLMEMGKEMGVLRGRNEELKEENRDLLFSITAGSKLKEMEGDDGGLLEKGEIEGGSISLPEEKKKGKGKGKVK